MTDKNSLVSPHSDKEKTASGNSGESAFSPDNLMKYEVGLFSIYAPSHWSTGSKHNMVQVSAPQQEMVFTFSAYPKGHKDFRSFADRRFSHVNPVYKLVVESEIEEGCIREYEGVWPGTVGNNRHIVFVKELAQAFLTGNVVTDQSHYDRHKALVFKVIENTTVALP